MSCMIIQQHNQSIHVTGAMTVMSLSGSLLQKIGAAMDCLCQITRNQQLLHKFEKWHKFLSCVKAKSPKKRSHKTRAACTQFYDRIMSVILI